MLGEYQLEFIRFFAIFACSSPKCVKVCGHTVYFAAMRKAIIIAIKFMNVMFQLRNAYTAMLLTNLLITFNFTLQLNKTGTIRKW